MDSAVVYLVPIGARRFELYSEPPDTHSVTGAPAPPAGFWHRLSDRLHDRWYDAVHTARHTESHAGTWTRLRDWTVRRTAEAIAEQRTLWTLRHHRQPSLVHPSDLSTAHAAAERDRILAAARKHHSRWLAFDLTAFAVSGLLVIVPGPNLIAYYFAFRVIGHYLSWLGARHAMQAAWDLRAEPALVELGRLADLPRDARATQVHAIAAGLNLPSLADFFDRTAVPARS